MGDLFPLFMKFVVIAGSYGQGVFWGVLVGSENALEVFLQPLHPLDAEYNISSPLAMGKI